MPHTIKIFSPASVANVGVGYDIMGFAIEGPGDEIIIREGERPGLTISKITGAKNKLPLDVEKNTAGYAAQRFLESIDAEKEAIDMEIRKKMPFGSGMGSSAASAAGGVFAVSKYLNTGHEKIDLLPYAVQGEQIADGAYHADNVAPALLGGMIIIRDNEALDLKKLHIPAGLTAVVIYPEVRILTKTSRSILSDTIPLKDVIKQTGNLAGFIAGMYTSDFTLIKNSLQDCIIEPQRAHLIPHFYEMKNQAFEEGALGFSISGAGPSMFALCDNTLIAEQVAEKAKRLYTDHKIRHKVYISPINHEGAFVY